MSSRRRFSANCTRSSDVAVAIDFANRVAACSVEAPGDEGIPTREMVAARWKNPR